MGIGIGWLALMCSIGLGFYASLENNPMLFVVAIVAIPCSAAGVIAELYYEHQKDVTQAGEITSIKKLFS